MKIICSLYLQIGFCSSKRLGFFKLWYKKKMFGWTRNLSSMCWQRLVIVLVIILALNNSQMRKLKKEKKEIIVL